MQDVASLTRRRFRLALALCWVGWTSAVSAMPLVLSDVPIFLGFQVAPNIMLTIDDSGSMDWEILTRDASNDGRFTGTQPDGSNPADAGSVHHRDNNDDGIISSSNDCGFGINDQTFYGYLYGAEFATATYTDDSRDCNTADDEEWRFRNYHFNPLYFNPSRVYSPWAGVDAAGNAYQNMSITAAKDNPYDPNSRTIDLTRHNSNWAGNTNDRDTSDRDGDGIADGFRYYTWADLNNNGRFDNGEETVHFIRNESAEVQQNFANWFSYYRKRLHVAKAVYGDIIANATNVRMGLTTLHNNRNGIKTSVSSVNTPIRDINADPTIGNKRTLLDALYSMNAENGTPLRTTMRNVGQYFECASGRTLFSTDCPALSAAAGGGCQQNFLIFMTDGFENGSSPFVGNADGDSNTRFDGGAYADSQSSTLADVAMYYYERDLQTSLPNNVPITPGVDEANHQHVVTYTVSFGPTGTLTSDPPNRTSAFSWPNPFDTDAAKIDDLRHAAYNGRGLFLNANDPQQLQEALRAAFLDIADRTSSAASVALNSGSRNANSRVYQARFNSGDWSGQLLSLPVQSDGSLESPEWDAGQVLDRLNYDTDRVIVTYKPSTSAGIPFRWSSLDTAQQTLLSTNASGTNDGQGEARLDFLRGSKTHEGQGNRYRVRLHTLGDLVNSDPFFVGAPPYPDSIGDAYATFRNTYSTRTPMVMVGSNDGLFHVFNATTGREILAYAPNVLFNQLSRLTSQTYTHRYFVDGSPTAGDVRIDINRNGQLEWRTIVVSGLRAGGQGYFALDVTDPAAFSETNAARLALWEFTDAHDADLGYSFSQPSLVRMANGRWAAVFGNGYNNSVADGRTSTTGRAYLFIVFLDAGLDGTWTLGTDYIKLDTSVGSVDTPNGLATPTSIDTNGDGTVEYIVAGDLRGNLWMFDVSNANPSLWTVAYRNTLGVPQPLFTARDANGVAQPITSRPEVGAHPDSLGGFVVYFGTGKYLETNDNLLTGATPQTFYGIWAKTDGVVPSITRTGNLVQQSVLSEIVVSGKTVRVTSDNAIDWVTKRGWYMDLPLTGERQVSDSVLRNGRIIFTTLIPNGQICSFGGTSYLMELDVSGRRLENPPFDLNGDQKFDLSDKVTATINGTATAVTPGGIASTEGILPSPTILSAGPVELKYNSGSSGGILLTVEDPGQYARGRQAWRQLF
ncbi:MAG: pilus assembly protein [Candidatus Tectimicrobiota bacterium]